jgi:hypothetical protein
MDRKEVDEILAAHANGLVAGNLSGTTGFSRNQQVQALLNLAGQVQAILVPVQPDAHFRRRLHGELLLAAQQRQTETPPSIFYEHRKGIILGAAAVGSVASVVGVAIAFVLRYRHGRATNIAAG